MTFDSATIAEWDRLVRNNESTYQQIGEQYDMTGEAVRHRVRDWRRGKRQPQPDAPAESDFETPLLHPATGKPLLDQKGEIVFEDRRQPPTDGDSERLLHAYLAVMEAAKPFNTAQRSARIRIEGDLPIGIAHFSDQHIGAWGWAAQRMLQDYQIAAEEDGLFVNLLGDDIDNFIFNFAKWASVMPPEHQQFIMQYLTKRLREKTLAFVIGNHQHWTVKTTNIDYLKALAWLEKAVYLGHGGDLFVTLGNQTYHGHLRHKSQGNSALNKSNPARRTSDDIGGADWIVDGHIHQPWIHQEYKARKRQTWMRCGTYKLSDDHAEAEGYPPAACDMPMVVLYPDRHDLVPFLNFRHGLATLRAERAEYRRRLVAKEASA